MTDSQLNVTFLGMCGNQTATHEATSLLFSADGTRVVVDAGPGIVRQVYRAGILCADVDAIIITHSHADHSGGFTYLTWSNFYDRLGGAEGPDTLHVYALPEVLAGLEANLRFAYNPATFQFGIEWYPLSASSVTSFSVGPLFFKSVPVEHSVPNVGIRCDYNGRSVSYSSDTTYAASFVDLAASSDVMVHEAFAGNSLSELAARTKHSTAAEAGRAAQAAGARRLELVHLFPPLLSKTQELSAEAAVEFDGEVNVPDELSRIEL
jgi:ribonuclease BN (tRNA processing enzyme)